MPKFDVTVHYHGTITYIIEAPDAEMAERIGRQQWGDSVASDCPSGDSEWVADTTSSVLPDERNEQSTNREPDQPPV